MAVMMESLSTITVIARTTISAVYRAAQIVASLPNLSYQNKARNNLPLLSLIHFSTAKFNLLILISSVFYGLGIP